jgi:GTP cyclohydrolase I
MTATSAGGAAARAVDHAGVERAARELLRALGADVDSDALEETPRRVADAYRPRRRANPSGIPGPYNEELV